LGKEALHSVRNRGIAIYTKSSSKTELFFSQHSTSGLGQGLRILHELVDMIKLYSFNRLPKIQVIRKSLLDCFGAIKI
jgi:hypothetical protein